MLKHKCLKMIGELQHYKHSSEERLIYYMNERLNLSLNTYATELKESIEYLSSRKNPSTTMRRITK